MYENFGLFIDGEWRNHGGGGEGILDYLNVKLSQLTV